MKHSDGPYLVAPGLGIYTESDEGPKWFAEFSDGPNWPSDTEEIQDNMDFAAHACNHHYSLLDALSQLVVAFRFSTSNKQTIDSAMKNAINVIQHARDIKTTHD